MKKTALASILFMFFFTGCIDNSNDSGIVEVRENMFVTQVINIFINQNEYLGKTIRLEGLFRHNHWDGNDFYFVFRNGPTCCGEDGQVGFEVSWDPDYFESDDEQRSYPNTNDWVQAIGELRAYDSFGMTFLYLALSELNVLEKRGAEFVFR